MSPRFTLQLHGKVLRFANNQGIYRPRETLERVQALDVSPIRQAPVVDPRRRPSDVNPHSHSRLPAPPVPISLRHHWWAHSERVPSGDVEVVVLPSGLQIVRLEDGDEIWALPRPAGLWVMARAKVRFRIGRPHTFAVRRCHPGYHRSLDAAVRCAKKKLPELHDQANAIRTATAPHDREIRQRRNERVGPGWQKIRRQVLGEEPICPCGAASVEVHHIIPVVLGGTSERDNLQALCKACHHPARKER